MKIILSNDDGYQARGINEVKRVLAEYQPTMVAPLREMSSKGHGITVREELNVKKIANEVYAVDGKPADCLLWAADQLFVPDLVISGINHGSNLAQDIYYSGTVAAAREGCFRGSKGIAISLFNNEDEHGHFETASWVLKKIIDSKIISLIDPGVLININVPNIELKDLKGVRSASLGWRNYSATYRATSDDSYQFQGTVDPISEKQGTDTYYVQNGFASASFLSLPESTCISSPEIIAELEKIVVIS